MITPELKDRILTDLIEGDAEQILETSSSVNYGIKEDTFQIILDQFEERGYITQEKFIGSNVRISIKANAHDFIRLGGFVGQDELLKANIEKLGLEIDLLCKNLTPDLLEKAHKIATISQSIMSSLALMN